MSSNPYAGYGGNPYTPDHATPPPPHTQAQTSQNPYAPSDGYGQSNPYESQTNPYEGQTQSAVPTHPSALLTNRTTDPPRQPSSQPAPQSRLLPALKHRLSLPVSKRPRPPSSA